MGVCVRGFAHLAVLRAIRGVEPGNCGQYVPLRCYGKSTARPTIAGYTPGPDEDMRIRAMRVDPANALRAE